MTNLADHLGTLAACHTWANDRLSAAAAALRGESYRRAAGANFGSLHGTSNHLLVVDRLWLRRLTGEGGGAGIALRLRDDAVRAAASSAFGGSGGPVLPPYPSPRAGAILTRLGVAEPPSLDLPLMQCAVSPRDAVSDLTFA